MRANCRFWHPLRTLLQRQCSRLEAVTERKRGKAVAIEAGTCIVDDHRALRVLRKAPRQLEALIHPVVDGSIEKRYVRPGMLIRHGRQTMKLCIGGALGTAADEAARRAR